MDIPAMSSPLFQLLNGENLESKQHEAMMVLTVSEDLWPHTAMISVGEVVALNSNELKLAIWKGTTTAANMLRTSKATLVIFYKGIANYIRLSLKHLSTELHHTHEREHFYATVSHVKEDIAKYAEITSGIKIQLKNSKDVLHRWEQQIEKLLDS